MVTVKLTFKGKINFMAYHSHLVDFGDGETKSVPVEVAEYLLQEFPDCFTAEGTKAKAIDEPVKHRMITGEAKTKKTGRR